MITRLIWTPMSSVPQKADKLNLSLSLWFNEWNSSQLIENMASGFPFNFQYFLDVNFPYLVSMYVLALFDVVDLDTYHKLNPMFWWLGSIVYTLGEVQWAVLTAISLVCCIGLHSEPFCTGLWRLYLGILMGPRNLSQSCPSCVLSSVAFLLHWSRQGEENVSYGASQSPGRTAKTKVAPESLWVGINHDAICHCAYDISSSGGLFY